MVRWGKYSDVTKCEMPRGSFGGNKWVDSLSIHSISLILGLNTATGCRVGDNTINDRPDCGAWYLRRGGRPPSRRRRSGGVGSLGVPLVDPDIKPMENYGVPDRRGPPAELGRELGAGSSTKRSPARSRTSVSSIPGIGEVYVIGNPGEGITAGPTDEGLYFPKPQREYDALELTFDKRFADNWSLRAYYTLSRPTATTLRSRQLGRDGQHLQNPVHDPANRSQSFAKRQPSLRLGSWGCSDEDGKHVLRRAADGPDPISSGRSSSTASRSASTSVSTSTSAAELPSRPTEPFLSATSSIPTGAAIWAGTAWLTQTDLSLFYTFTFGHGMGFTVGLTVLNLFDQDTVLSTWEQDCHPGCSNHRRRCA